jgi:hypothetical protein
LGGIGSEEEGLAEETVEVVVVEEGGIGRERSVGKSPKGGRPKVRRSEEGGAAKGGEWEIPGRNGESEKPVSGENEGSLGRERSGDKSLKGGRPKVRRSEEDGLVV